jgi:ubiquinone/menaquinone biosynthesis C-methylase UbiE
MVALTAGEAGNLPFADETFGTVVYTNAMHYFQHPEMTCFD